MKKRVKKKIEKRKGYKRYDNYNVYLHALSAIKLIQKIIDEADINLISLNSIFGNKYKHQIITNKQLEFYIQLVPLSISIYIFEVKDFKDLSNHIYSKRGELFYNIIRKHYFVSDKVIFIYGDTRYNNHRYNGLFYLEDMRFPDTKIEDMEMVVEFVANPYRCEALEKVVDQLKGDIFGEEKGDENEEEN